MSKRQFGGLVNKAMDDIRAMKACPGHEWEGPIEVIEFDFGTMYQVLCKHCPLGKHFRTRQDAEEAMQ